MFLAPTRSATSETTCSTGIVPAALRISSSRFRRRQPDVASGCVETIELVRLLDRDRVLDRVEQVVVDHVPGGGDPGLAGSASGRAGGRRGRRCCRRRRSPRRRVHRRASTISSNRRPPSPQHRAARRPSASRSRRRGLPRLTHRRLFSRVCVPGARRGHRRWTAWRAPGPYRTGCRPPAGSSKLKTGGGEDLPLERRALATVSTAPGPRVQLTTVVEEDQRRGAGLGEGREMTMFQSPNCAS